ncbi:MAG TPA: ChaN family lipoprotein, partial [Roseateles sp.]|nr:ChaN family lipoprotein [Roseateles sp.]
RDLARRGEVALPAELKAVTASAPLDEPARAALDADLLQGHCGMLGGERLVGMRWAQRARDAAMWLSLQEAAAAARPAVLLAGNGHVRLDYGVPQLARRLHPGARLVSVGFVDGAAKVAGAPYSHVWVTPAPAGRGEPCEGMKSLTPPQPSQPTPAGAAGAP